MEEISKQLFKVISQVFGDLPEFQDIPADFLPEVTVAPENFEADFSSNVAMQLVKELKRSPREIAEDIVHGLKELGDEFQFQVEVAGPGFLNFIASDEYYMGKIDDFRADFDKNISQDEYLGKRVVCEFSDPNPFKVLHVGHLYTSIVGDAISRLIEFSGGEVSRVNFGGDVGLHVAKTLYALEKKLDEDARDVDIQLIADCYVEGTRAYEEDEVAKNKIVELNKRIYQIAEKGADAEWSEDGAINMKRLAKLYWQGRELSYQYFEDFYKRVGVKFDKYYPESTVSERGLSEVREHIGEVYEESDSAIIFPGEKYDLHTRVFINKEGLPTYEAKDVGLIFSKWDDYHFDQSVVITGNDIIDYMKVVLKSISLYAPELVERTLHLTHGNVRLPGNEKMSSRKGNFIKAVDVLDGVEDLIKENSHEMELTDGSSMIGLGAIKYAFLKYKIGGNIEFNMRDSVSMTGNSGVYLQYSTVRAKKILLAATNPLVDDLSACRAKKMEARMSLTDNKFNQHEKKLIRKVLEYKSVLSEAVKELAPHKIANYLFELAQEFSRFYENVKVVGSDEESIRLEMVAMYFDTMMHGLNLMGISVPEEM